MTSEERFEVLMKNCEQMRYHNEELKNQNEYLRRQLDDAMKQKRRDIRRSQSSNSPDSV